MINYGKSKYMDNFDAYLKKDISYNYRGKELKFYVSQALFSSHSIDLGTNHLLKTLTSEGFNKYNKVLDLGCGYGPIGNSLKSFYEPSVVHMVDRDALALEFSKQNVKFNNLSGVKIYGSLGYDDISDTDFDLIVSNIPAKVGEPVLSHVLEDARFYLCQGGKVAIVVIDAIGDYVTKVLKSNKNINILFYKRWSGYLVFHYEFLDDSPIRPKLNAFDRGLYNRGKQNILFDNSEVSIETAYGLSEFDTLSYETETILNKLKDFKDREINRAIIFNPEQGIIPTVLAKTTKVKEINLIDRDLEALRMSKKNLISSGFNPEKILLFHEVGIPKTNKGLADLVIGILDEKDDPKVHLMLVKEAREQLLTGGLLILGSGSTPITRIESFIKRGKLFEVIARQKSKRKSLIVLKRRN
ncbi:hypothetical protein COT03_00965 [Candidatus Shapirobacteria bacterium CG07_land_8_20_14_0_80_39_18]|uniref:Methyltransferase small domain-containing protein n=1 Tax=Candidatus Shapirobacteria bacterium CG07_land_8_20_14_0_80_39_18 TaxID=1974882 RepID=A0A2M6YRS5_9BACT|nr:MAG: hypothetical protein COT03_00965 [Candidatus Shapirobacteria bacterium CG07_land_8_20_14_0_80_39_18]